MSKTTFPMIILVAVDGSKPSREGLRMAGEVAKATGSTIHAIVVGMTSRYVYPDNISDGMVERMRGEAQEKLDSDLAWAKEHGIEVAESYVRLGRHDGEVIRMASELDAGLIVIGNRGLNAIKRILLGNDAESIVRHAHCPVLVARLNEP